MSIDDQPRTEAAAAPHMPAIGGGTLPRNDTPIVPKTSIGGTALVAVVAIMTFLAALTTGAVVLIAGSASEWQADVAREITVQIKPKAGRELETDVARAAAIAQAQPGIAEVRPYSREESARLLEPWLGAGAALSDLPVPRIIVVKLATGGRADLKALRQALAEIPGASLDDHRGFIDRMRTMAAAAFGFGVGILVLVLVATVLSVTFATNGAMATNRPIIEVLHFVGAKDSYISGHFQRHFLVLGLKGGAIGGAAAIALMVLAQLATGLFPTAAGAAQATALFGSFALGPWGYAAVAAQILLIAAVTALSSRYTVNHTLASIA